VSEAGKRRAERAKSDPEYLKRVDQVLNEGRVNFLLFGYGETHEPPVTEKEIIGSQTIVSYDLETREADIISLTHDIRAPEIERAFWKPGQKYHALRIDQAYNIGGFKLMRRTLENATGLAVDFQITFRDRAIQSLVDDVFGGVEVQVPVEFRTQPFYLDGKKYDKGYFPQGVQRMDGKRVIQFIKTVPITEGYYGKPLEHNVRKHLVFTALLESVRRNYKERKFWLGGTTFLTKELVTGAIVYDFDPLPLMINNIGETAGGIEKLATAQTRDLEMPTIDTTLYIVDPAHGDGGVTWIEGDAATNPVTKKDIEAQVYPHMAFEVPRNANPYGDLVIEYWQSVRSVVRDSLLPEKPVRGLQRE
jgi:hypothetical protein